MKLKNKKSKTDQYREGDEVAIAETGLLTYPVSMLRRYTALGEIELYSEAALFCLITGTKSVHQEGMNPSPKLERKKKQ